MICFLKFRLIETLGDQLFLYHLSSRHRLGNRKLRAKEILILFFPG